MVALSLQQGQDAPSVLSDLELARQLQHEEYQQHHPHPQPGPSQPLPAQVTGCPPAAGGAGGPRAVGGSLQVPPRPKTVPVPTGGRASGPRAATAAKVGFGLCPPVAPRARGGPAAPSSPCSASSREILWAGVDTRMTHKLPSGLNTRGSHSGGAPSGGSHTSVHAPRHGWTCGWGGHVHPPVQNVALAFGK